MRRAALLLTLLTTACASGAGAPISYGRDGAPAEQTRETPRPANRIDIRRETPREAERPAQAAPTPAAPVTWDGGGTPLSAYALQPGDAQPFDPANLPRTHQVSGTESLFDIATRYQLPLRALIDENDLEPPYALAPGRVLNLPPPRFHTVARGEAFEDVARRYNVDLRSLALLNRMQPPYRVRAGDRIVLPALARAQQSAPIETPTPVVERTAPAPVRGSGRFAWPLRGDIVARFGAQEGGGRLDGMEIAGAVGAPILAAADGEVVYAGSDLPGYGTVILVRHADDYVTAYAYAQRALVREGQRVRVGERIGEVGTHAGGRARLMFQVRRGSAAVDPEPLLGAAAR